MPYLILLIIGCLATNPDHWHQQIMLGEMGVFIWLSNEIRKKHWVPALCFLYFGMHAVWCSYSYSSPFLGYNVINSNGQTSIDHGRLITEFGEASAQYIEYFLCTSLPFIFSKDLKNWSRAFHVLAVISGAVMLYNRMFHGVADGLIGNSSVNGTYLALILPSFLFPKNEPKIKQDNHLISLFLIIVIVLSQSSTAYGCLCLEILIWSFLKMKKTLTNFAVLSLGAISSVPLGYFLMKNQLFEPNGRQYILKMAYTVFVHAHKFLLGLGTGSFIVLMPYVQGTNHEFFPFLHNDPLQVLFEQGLIGFSLLIVLFSTMLWRSRKDIGLFITLAATGFESFFQMPFRYFPTALFCAFLCRCAFENNIESNHMKGIL